MWRYIRYIHLEYRSIYQSRGNISAHIGPKWFAVKFCTYHTILDKISISRPIYRYIGRDLKEWLFLKVYPRRLKPGIEAQASSSPIPSTEASTLELPIALRKGTQSYTTKHHIIGVVSFSDLSPTYFASASVLSSVSVPTSYYDALRDPRWKKAMDKKMVVLYQNQTWTFLYPLGKSLLVVSGSMR